jgi:translocation and assembly module TamB
VVYEGHELRNLEPVVVRYAGESIALDSLFLHEPATESELFAQGTIGLGEGGALALNVQGSLSTDWVEPLVPQVEVDGTFDVLASVRGTVSEPRFNGQGELREGRLIVDGFPQSLDDLTAVVLFYPQQIVLDRARARVGGGTARASGRVVPPWAGDGDLDYSLQASLDDVTLRYPEGFWLRSDAALSLLSTPDGRILRGTVQLDRAYYVQDIEVSLFQIMRRALRADRLEVAETGEIESTTQLAVSVSAPGTVRVRNNLADLTGSADLTVRGTIARPVVFGEVEIDRGGTLVYSDTEFEVERARLTFASPTRIDPIVDLVATADIREYDVTLMLSGKLDGLRAQVTSDPPLSDLDVVALLTTGQAPDERGLTPGITDLETFASDTAERFLYGQAASVVSDRLETLFGVDTLRISPVTGESGSTVGSVTIGKRLSSDVLVTYTSQPSDTEEYLVQVEWQVDENLTLIFTSVEGESYRVDARWDKRF